MERKPAGEAAQYQAGDPGWLWKGKENLILLAQALAQLPRGHLLWGASASLPKKDLA